MGSGLKVAIAVAALAVGAIWVGAEFRSSREEARVERFAAEARTCLDEFEADVAARKSLTSFYECYRTGHLDLDTVNRVLARHGMAPLKL